MSGNEIFDNSIERDSLTSTNEKELINDAANNEELSNKLLELAKQAKPIEIEEENSGEFSAETVKENPGENLRQAILEINNGLPSGYSISSKSTGARLKSFGEEVSPIELQEILITDRNGDVGWIGNIVMQKGEHLSGEVKNVEEIKNEIEAMISEKVLFSRALSDEAKNELDTQFEKKNFISNLENIKPNDLFENKEVYDTMIEVFDDLNLEEKGELGKKIEEYLNNYNVILTENFKVIKLGENLVIKREDIKSGFPGTNNLELFFGEQ